MTIPPRTTLGELEELVLLLVALHDADAYGVMLAEELERQAGRSISISAVHAVLHRLENKGLVKSSMGGASDERGGRRKRLFSITSAGRKTIEEVRNLRNHIWNLILEISPS
jgi:PadR family transcriptional regulator, regulatory protein PadR